MTDRSTGGAEGAILETKTLMSEFVRDFRGFQERVETRLKTQDDRIARLDRKSVARPALSAAAEDRTPHAKAMAAYLRTGDESGLRAAPLDVKGLSTQAGTDGGFLVDRRTSGEIATVLRGAGSIRSVANVVAVEGGAYDVLVDRAEFESAWVTESGGAGETAATKIERVSIPLHELAALPKASQRLIEDSAFDIESWLARAVAEKFSRAETAAFVNGDGVDKPKGFLAHPKAPAASWAWGSIGYVATGSAGGFSVGDPSDCLVDLVYSLGARYRANAAFVMNSTVAGAVRKFRDTNGRFLWTEGLGEGQPARLLGYPVVTCEEMPDIADGAFAIAFGDFSAGYTIAERPDLRVLRDPYSAKPHVQFYATARVGGDVTDFAAIRLLKFATA